MKISVLYLGYMEFPRFRLIECEDESVMVKSPAAAILIQHPTLGNILYDTGNSPDYETVYTPAMLHDYPIQEMVTIKEALAAKGLTPDDIDTLIISHLHFDHAGGMKDFVGTKAIKNVMVAEADLKNAYFSVMTGSGGAYIRELFDVEGVQFQPVNGTVELAPDLALFVQESHTPGVIGLILKTQNNGNIICTSDAVYLADSYNKETPPGGTINATTSEFFDNLAVLKAMEKEYNATMLFGHDQDQVLEFMARGEID